MNYYQATRVGCGWTARGQVYLGALLTRPRHASTLVRCLKLKLTHFDVVNIL